MDEEFATSHPRLTGLLLPTALGSISLLAHLLTSRGYGYFRDELYYIACGEHLAWGYVDHPPLIALIAVVGRRLLGDSLFAIHLLPALAAALVVFLAALIAREIGGGRVAQALAGAAVIVGPFFLVSGNLLSTIVFDQLCWVLASFLILRLLRTQDPRYFVWIGIVCGVGLMTKHNMLFFGFGLAVALVVSPERKFLHTRWPWLGGGLAALIFLPHIFWQISHGWPTLAFLRGLRASVLTHTPLKAILLDGLFSFNPFTVPIALLGFYFFLRAEAGRRYRMMGWLIVVVFAMTLAQRGKVYYLAPLYPTLLAGGAFLIEAFTRARSWKWAPAATFSLFLASGAAMAPMAVAVLPLNALLKYTEFIGMTRFPNWTGKADRLPHVLADMLGWPELVEDVAKVYSSLPPQERAAAGIYASNFGEAGALDFWGSKYGLPRAISPDHNYFYWKPENASPEILVVVGERPENVARSCRNVELKAIHTHPYAFSLEKDVPITVCRGLITPLNELWPQLRRGF